jgi:hypothetical protein
LTIVQMWAGSLASTFLSNGTAYLPMYVIPALVIASALSVCPVHVLNIRFVVPTYLVELVAICSITALSEAHTGGAITDCNSLVKVVSTRFTSFSVH